MLRTLTLVTALVSTLLVAVSAAAQPYPAEIQLPPGWQPEGIAVGKGHTFYVGSIPTGAIYAGDLRTGDGDQLVAAQEDRSAVGIEVDSQNRIFVAGGMTGDAYVYDALTGDPLAAYELAPDGATTFLNDVVVTRDAVYVTDSRDDVLYRLPLGPNGSLPDEDDVETIQLGGEFAFDAVGLNLNGIDATPDGHTLIAVQTGFGRLYTIDPGTGEANLIELTGLDDNVEFGDGILLHGRTLYVVQNRLNRIAVVRLAADLGSGTIVSYIESAEFDIPTTIAEHGRRLYAVNARFGTAGQQPAEYSVVQVLRHLG